MTTAPPANTVILVGHISSEPQQRQLPSGDVLVSFRLVVPRTKAARTRTRQSVDTIECSVWTARLRRAASRLAPGDDIRVTGQLRRTFRRSTAGVRSWMTVDVDQLERISPAEALS
jgi:single-strand DNA-binding protein